MFAFVFRLGVNHLAKAKKVLCGVVMGTHITYHQLTTDARLSGAVLSLYPLKKVFRDTLSSTSFANMIVVSGFGLAIVVF